MHIFANFLWFLSTMPESLAFGRAVQNVAQTQQQYLLRLVRRNADTNFGRRYGFTSIRSVADYQMRVPLSTYDDYQPAIKQISTGQPNMLTREPVLLLEPTSGSTAATKLIPYTASLKAEFQCAIAPWIADLFWHDPRLLLGQAYWSVSPVVGRNQHTPGGIPIGFEEDSEYFGRWQRHLVQAIQAVPPLVKLIDEMDTFRYVTLLFLLRSQQLTLISVWNPTFLTLLVKPLLDWWPQLVADIELGTLSPPKPLAADLLEAFQARNRPQPRRAATIRAIFQTESDLAAVHARLWPQLRLISCWLDAQAAPYAAHLAQLFPQARLQGKGLLATEGVVSFPLTAQPGAALALRSHFFEFQPAAETTTPLLAHQLETGGQYEVILTTGGGLYRYQLHDLVEVVGHFKQCPLIRFVGKTAHVSDNFGEKLNERHVRQALADALKTYGLQPVFAMLAGETELAPPAYVLFIEINQAADATLQQLAATLDIKLQDNFHYRYCRDLGQLAALCVFRIDRDGLSTYITACQTHGQRAGDIKPVSLHRRGGWLKAFYGQLLPGQPD